MYFNRLGSFIVSSFSSLLSRRLIYFVAGVASPLLRQLFCVSFDSNVRAQLPDPTHPLLINDNLRSNMFVQAAFVSPVRAIPFMFSISSNTSNTSKLA